MSWFSSRTANAASDQATPALKQKRKQIESLRDHFVSVIEVRRDELYRLNITVDGRSVVLDISLPPRFPLVGPVVTVFPPIKHTWVNEQMVVDGSPLVKNFSTHSNLGRAIQQVVKEFSDHPPQFLDAHSLPALMAHHPMPLPHSHSGPIPLSLASVPPNQVYHSQPGIQQNGGIIPPYPYNDPGVGGAPLPETQASRRPAPPPPPGSVRQNSVSAKSYKPPPIPDSFEDVKSMSTEDLEQYIGEAEGFVLVDKYVSELPFTKKLQEDRNDLFAENETQADTNLSYEAHLEEMWSELQHKCLELENLKSEYEKKLNEQRQLIKRYDVGGVTSKMKTLAQDADTQSEIIAEDFLEGKVAVKDFIQQYKQERMLHHLRKIKHENLSYSGGRR